MEAIEALNVMTHYARNYTARAQRSLKLNRHMNEIEQSETVKQEHIEAVLVDFINYIGFSHGIDYALNAKDIKG